MKIVVVGAGGLGSYVGAVLARAGHDVTLVARGDQAAAIAMDGLRVTTVDGDFTTRPRCVASATDVAGADLTFVAVKSYSLDEVGPQLVHLGRAGSVVVPLLNGVTASERLLGLGVPGDRIADGIAYITAFRTGPGLIERKGRHQRLVVGTSTGADSASIGRIARAFGQTDVEVAPTDDVVPALWQKMAVVCSLSVICGLTRSPMGRIRAHRFGAELQRRAIAEVTAVARASGVRLPQGIEGKIGAILDAFPGDFFPSVLHDLRSGRRTEMDELGGVISLLGRAHGIDTPLHDAATCGVQASEGRGPASAPVAARQAASERPS